MEDRSLPTAEPVPAASPPPDVTSAMLRGAVGVLVARALGTTGSNGLLLGALAAASAWKPSLPAAPPAPVPPAEPTPVAPPAEIDAPLAASLPGIPPALSLGAGWGAFSLWTHPPAPRLEIPPTGKISLAAGAGGFTLWTAPPFVGSLPLAEPVPSVDAVPAPENIRFSAPPDEFLLLPEDPVASAPLSPPTRRPATIPGTWQDPAVWEALAKTPEPAASAPLPLQPPTPAVAAASFLVMPDLEAGDLRLSAPPTPPVTGPIPPPTTPLPVSPWDDPAPLDLLPGAPAETPAASSTTLTPDEIWDLAAKETGPPATAPQPPSPSPVADIDPFEIAPLLPTQPGDFLLPNPPVPAEPAAPLLIPAVLPPPVSPEREIAAAVGFPESRPASEPVPPRRLPAFPPPLPAEATESPVMEAERLRPARLHGPVSEPVPTPPPPRTTGREIGFLFVILLAALGGAAYLWRAPLLEQWEKFQARSKDAPAPGLPLAAPAEGPAQPSAPPPPAALADPEPASEPAAPATIPGESPSTPGESDSAGELAAVGTAPQLSPAPAPPDESGAPVPAVTEPTSSLLEAAPPPESSPLMAVDTPVASGLSLEKPAPAPPAAAFNPDVRKATPAVEALAADTAEARSLVLELAQASAISQVTAVIHDPGRLAGTVAAYHQGTPLAPLTQPHAELAYDGKVPGTDRRALIFNLSSSEKPRGFPVNIEETAQGWKVDWETFIQWRDRHLGEFMENRPKGKKSFFVIVRRAHYFGDDLDKHAQRDCYTVTSAASGEASYYVFVDKNSPAGLGIAQKFDWNKSYFPYIELEWTKDRNGTEFVRFDRIIRTSWREMK